MARLAAFVGTWHAEFAIQERILLAVAAEVHACAMRGTRRVITQDSFLLDGGVDATARQRFRQHRGVRIGATGTRSGLHDEGELAAGVQR